MAMEKKVEWWTAGALCRRWEDRRTGIDSLPSRFATSIPGSYAPGGGRYRGLVRRTGIFEPDRVRPVHVAACLQQKRTALSVKLRLSAIQILFDWLVVGQMVPANPAIPVNEACGEEGEDAGPLRRESAWPAQFHRPHLCGKSPGSRPDGLTHSPGPGSSPRCGLRE